MSRISWDSSGSHRYESGIDRGVLYIDGQPGVPWNGLTSVTETATGGVAQPVYVDGEKVLNLASREEYQATITAYTYPDEFESCDGVYTARPGLFVTNQPRVSFGLSYRTLIGNDLNNKYAYKIHLVYNVLASPSTKSYKSNSNSTQVDDFSWGLTSLPPVMAGYKRSSHVVIDSRTADPRLLTAIENVLYGDDTDNGRLLTLAELIDLADTNATLVVVDNGDGTFTITAPSIDLVMLDDSIFQLSWPTALFVDANTFTVSS